MHAVDKMGQPRFLCDEMLTGFARWLRAAGYDTRLCDSGWKDRDILALARKEQRFLITRDHKLSEFRDAGDTVIWLRCNDIDTCASELGQKTYINWLLAPFSRCMRCNTLLVKAEPAALSRVPDGSQKLADPLMFCPVCDKVYWQGSHVERMLEKLQSWVASTQ